MKTQISPTAIAVTAACVLFQAVSALALPADVLFHEDFENPDVAEYSQGITPEIWVRASVGFGSGDHGMTDKSDGDFSAPAGNEQAYAFRYKNSGITTKEFALGPPLAFGGGYEVSFDVVMDNSTSGRAYNVGLIAFGAGAIRNDCRSIPTGSTQLATATGNAPADGSIATVTFTFIPNATTHAAEFGKDPGIRVKGSGASAIIDNIRFRAIPGTGTGLNLVTTSPVDNSSNNLAYLPAKAIFNKNIAAGSGNITLRDLTDNIDTVIPVGDPRISISGTCLNVVAGAPYTWGRNYAIRIDPGAVVEASPGANSFAGIADDITWNFSTAGGDPLYYSISRLKDHITGAITLTAAEIDTIKRNLDTVVGRFAESSASITALLDLIHTYDTGTITGRKGPLWVSQSLPRRDSVTNDLHWTMFNVMQNVMDRIYTATVLAAHEDLLDGFKFGSHTNFPGPCPPPADPTASHTVTIQGSFEDTFGRHTQQWTLPARKPTGTYLAPGTIATVTVPPEIVNLGYQVRVGAHSWNLAHRPHVRRLDRATRLYPIDAPTIKVANPYGGGIYIEVPFRADAGLIDVTVTGAVRAPYFSAKSFHQTTPAEWLAERAHPAPWADFQSDKFMTQVPTKWIYAHPDPAKMLADWDKAMDAINDLMGFPHLRGKETMYLQVDIIMRASVYAPGYPAVNVTDNPNNERGGYHTNYLVRGPGASSTAANWEFHEQGHAYFFPKFGGESESNVNLLHVPMLQKKFGYDLDTAFRGSLGSSNTYITLDTTAMAWMCVFNFAPRRLPMASAEKSYQFKGHAKFVDIARLYGWDGLGDFWRSFMEDDANGVSYSTSTDAKLLRLCKSVGKDIRPLFHFWGIHPDNPSSLAASIAAEGLQPAPEIYHRLVHYKSIVPANNAEFRTFAQSWRSRVPSINGYWEERDHARQWDTTPLYAAGDQQRSEETNPGEIYNEYSAADIRNRVDEIIDLYFPSEITPNPMTFATAPAAIDATTIGMVATTATATAATGPIEYYFNETSGNPGGNDSGWQTSPFYQDGGLTPGLTYSYTVTARDGLGNPTDPSAVASAMAETDVTPPAPDPLTFASPPTTLGSDAITMTATAATDINGVEYQFVCTAGDGNDSGWQDSPTYVDNGLQPDTSYTYRVRARDKSPAQNATDWSAEASATTDVPDTTAPTIDLLSPPNSAISVPVSTDLVITFDENITLGSGVITVRNLTDSTQVTIDVTDDSQVATSGQFLIINPDSDLSYAKVYAIQIDETAIQDLSGNPFAGISDDTTWSFATLLAPLIDGTWTQGLGGTYAWSETSNWLDDIVAGGTDATASFTVDSSGAQTVDLDTAVTLGNLILNRNQDLTITGAETFTMDVTTGIPIIDVGSGRTLDIFSEIAGTDGLQKDGAGTVRLRGTSTITGGVTVTGGTLQAFEVVANTIGNGPISLSGGGHLMLRGNNTSAGQFSVGDGGGRIQNRGNNTFTTTGILTGSGTLTFTDPGGSGGKNFNFNSTANDFTGGFVIENTSGHLFQVNSLVDSANNIVFNRASGSSTATFRYGAGAEAALTLNNRVFELNSGGGLTGIIENLNTTHAITVNTNLIATGLGAKTLSLRGNAGPTNVFAGLIPDETDDGEGTVALTKLGAGTWVLDGDNTYTGSTTISAGRLVVNGDQSAATGAVAVNGTSTLGGSGALGGDVTVATGANLAPGASVGTLSIGGDLNISAMAAGNGQLHYELGPIAASDRIAVTGALNIDSDVLGFSDFNFTNAGGLEDGTYTLITSGSISGPLDGADLTGPVGAGTGTLQLNGNNVELVVSGLGGGPGPVANFAISPIASPQTVGTPITGITITAQDASDATATSFTGTVTFGGTGGFSGTSGTFTDGVLTGVSVTPTVSGSDLTFTVDDGSGRTGSTTIATINPAPSAYDTWATQIADVNMRGPDDDPDGDGFSNLQEFLFGTSPVEPDGSLSTTEKSGSNLIIRWKERTDGAEYTLLQSSSLDNDWIPSSVVPVNDGSAVGGYQPRMATVATGPGKLFLRVQGVEN